MTLSPVQEIKEKIDIVDFIRSYIALLPAGKNFKAACPFHKEKTPSFMVSPDRQTWHCFGACAEGGDVFKFLMKYENIEFHEALKILAERAGVELRSVSPAEYRQFGILYEINEAAKDFFKKELARAEEVSKYAESRGLKRKTIEEFELGFAPPGFDRLTLDLVSIGFDVRDIERAGLVYKNERGGYVDRFRGRLMFPIYNNFGKVIGFSGRILPEYESAAYKSEGVGKYVNSPETPIFSKSRIFYGLHKTKNHIKEAGSALLVEGQMDFLMLYQDGLENAVATSGTALTGEHLRILRRLTDQLVFSFDSDEAGLKAAERSIDSAAANDFNVKLVILKNYKDPAEVVKNKPGLMAELVANAVPSMEFYLERYLDRKSKFDIGALKKNLRIVLTKIKNLASPVEKSHWLTELSRRTGIKEGALIEEMEQLTTKSKLQNSRLRQSFGGQVNSRQMSNEKSITKTSRRNLIAERLLSLVMTNDNLKMQIKDYVNYLPEDYSFILNNLAGENQGGAVGEKLNSILNVISLRASFELEVLGAEKIEEEFQALLWQIQYEYLKEKRNRLSHSLKELEEKGENQQITSALKEFDELSKMMENSR